ncbi:MAG: PEP-CTERM sorting domain-containing protein [Planctomycetota bacterium]
MNLGSRMRPVLATTVAALILSTVSSQASADVIIDVNYDTTTDIFTFTATGNPLEATDASIGDSARYQWKDFYTTAGGVSWTQVGGAEIFVVDNIANRSILDHGGRGGPNGGVVSGNDLLTGNALTAGTAPLPITGGPYLSEAVPNQETLLNAGIRDILDGSNQVVGQYSLTVDNMAVPEPSSALLLGLVSGGLAFRRRTNR